MELKVGDKVKIISGKDKGKDGKITHVFRKDNKIIVEGINMVTKHMKPKTANETGGIIKVESKIDASNVMIIDPKTNKTTRIYHDTNKNGKKVRVSKSHNELN